VNPDVGRLSRTGALISAKPPSEITGLSDVYRYITINGELDSVQAGNGWRGRKAELTVGPRSALSDWQKIDVDPIAHGAELC
jgi:hypothetical protein